MKITRNNFKLLLLFLLIWQSSIVISQNFIVSGVVSDKKGSIPGVNIKVIGTKTGVISDLNGKFSISAKPDAQLEISYIGYKTEIVDVNNRTKIDIELHESLQNLDEVVVIGYGSIKKRDVTGSIISVKEKDLVSSEPVSIGTALQGKVSGLEIMTTSEPGNSSTFRIRGTSTLSDGGSNPLFIVDGMEVDNIDDINPRDITSVEVLKDAASTAIYGSRSANGVIIVSTKQGDSEKPKIAVNYSLKHSEISRTLPQMNRLQGFEYEVLRNYFSGIYSSMTRDSLNPSKIQDNNYQELIFREAYTHQMDVSIAGADKKLKYFASAGYLNSQGIQINTYNNRLTSRLNVDYKATPKFTIGSKVALAFTDQRKATGESRNRIFSRPANYTTYEPDGSYSPITGNISNPVAESLLGKNDYNKYTANIYNYIDYSISKHLMFKSSIAVNFNLEKYRRFRPAILVANGRRSAINQETLWSGWTHEDVFTYKRKIKKNHDLTILGGFSLRESSNDVTALSVTDNITDALEIANTFEGVDLNNTKVTWSQNRMASFFGRLSYSYKGKYLINSNIRYDGSSRFGAGNKWALFPSVSAGWRFSDESFMKWSKPYLTDSKLRISYGATGNQVADDFSSLGLYTTNYYADMSGIYPNQLANEHLGWEQTEQYNLGLDLTLFDGKLIIGLDYYDKNTSNILYNTPLPQTSGFKSSFRNVGSVNNKGWELSLSSTNVKTKSFEWNSNVSLSFNKNVITSIPKDGRQLISKVFLLDKGYSVGTIYGWKAKGIFPYTESNAFTPDWQQLTPLFDNKDHFEGYQLNGETYNGEIKKLTANNTVLEGGDVMWDDIDKNGIIDAGDRQVLGCGQPIVNGGFNNELSYKGISLSFFFTFSLGGDVYNSYEQVRSEHRWSYLIRSNPVNIANSWLAPGDIAKFPRPNGTLAVDNTRAESSLWVENGSYIRLKNIRLSYTFPKEISKKLKVGALSASLMIQDYFTWTNYSGFDPELPSTGFTMGLDNRSYPRSKEILLGLNLNL